MHLRKHINSHDELPIFSLDLWHQRRPPPWPLCGPQRDPGKPLELNEQGLNLNAWDQMQTSAVSFTKKRHMSRMCHQCIVCRDDLKKTGNQRQSEGLFSEVCIFLYNSKRKRRRKANRNVKNDIQTPKKNGLTYAGSVQIYTWCRRNLLKKFVKAVFFTSVPEKHNPAICVEVFNFAWQ